MNRERKLSINIWPLAFGFDHSAENRKAKTQDLFFERYPHQRNRLRIILLFALKTQQIVIRAAFGGGEIATGGRSRVVNGATASFSIEEVT